MLYTPKDNPKYENREDVAPPPPPLPKYKDQKDERIPPLIGGGGEGSYRDFAREMKGLNKEEEPSWNWTSFLMGWCFCNLFWAVLKVILGGW